MSDRVVLSGMVFEGRHGVGEEERAAAQPFEVDVELVLDLRPAGQSDDLIRTVDYGAIFDACRAVVEGPSHLLVEYLAESIAARLLELPPSGAVSEVVVRVRKPEVPLPGLLSFAGCEIVRRR